MAFLKAKFLSSRVKGLHAAAYLLGFFTLFSQVLGLIRDRILASTFGASGVLDIYYAAFKIPDLILALGASVASTSILVPLLTRHIEENEEAGKKFIDEIFTSFSLFIIVVCCIIFFLIPYATSIVFPGFTSFEDRSAVITLTRILLLSPIILGISNIYASIAQVYNRFFVYALSPVLYNVGILIGIIALYPLFGLRGLGFGVILGALLHAGIQVPALISEDFFPKFKKVTRFEELRTVVLTSLPRAFTMSVNQIVLIVLIGFASLAVSGSITVFNFSYNLQSVPLAIIGVSYSLAAFPLLSKMIAQGKEKDFTARIVYVGLHILVLAVPVSVLFIMLRTYIVSILYGIGEFGIQAIRLTAFSTALFALSIPAQSLQLLFLRAYYAAGMTKRPLIITVFGGGLSILAAYGFNGLFEKFPSIGIFLAHIVRLEAPLSAQVLMLPLAYSLGMCVSVALLWKMFTFDFKDSMPVLKPYKASAEIIVSALGVGVITYTTLALLRVLARPTNQLLTLLELCVAGLVGAIAGYLILRIFGNRPADELSIALRKRFSPKGVHAEIASPEQHVEEVR